MFPQNQLKPVILLLEQATTFNCKFISIRLFYILYFKAESQRSFRTAAKHQQTSTFKPQKWGSFYVKFNAEYNEFGLLF